MKLNFKVTVLTLISVLQFSAVRAQEKISLELPAMNYFPVFAYQTDQLEKAVVRKSTVSTVRTSIEVDGLTLQEATESFQLRSIVDYDKTPYWDVKYKTNTGSFPYTMEVERTHRIYGVKGRGAFKPEHVLSFGATATVDSGRRSITVVKGLWPQITRVIHVPHQYPGVINQVALRLVSTIPDYVPGEYHVQYDVVDPVTKKRVRASQYLNSLPEDIVYKVLD